MRKTTIGLICWILGLVSPAWGEFYQYRDSGGVIRFTDNIAIVPADQRQTAKSYQEEVSPSPKAPAASLPEGTPAENQAESEREPSAGQQPQPPDPEIENRLRAIKSDLDREYDALQQQIETLQREKEAVPSHAYNDMALSLNKKIADYESRRSAYQKDLEDYRNRRSR
jgi:hypothetical protein